MKQIRRDTLPGNGDLLVTQWLDENRVQHVRITHADPQIKIAPEFITEARAAPTRWMSYQPEPPSVIMSDDYGHRYIYRLDHQDQDTGIWYASWPD